MLNDEFSEQNFNFEINGLEDPSNPNMEVNDQECDLFDVPQ